MTFATDFSRIRVLFTALACVGTLAGGPAVSAANSTGIFGFSGRNGSICTTCHSGGREPDVEFEAPQGTQMFTGAVATFRFKITSGRRAQQTHAGFDVAPSGGTIIVTDTIGTRIALPGLPDITHTTPRANDGSGVAVFEFDWQAPAMPGPYTLFGAGNSVDFDGTLGGDDAAGTTLQINVIAAATATATTTETPTITPSTTPSPSPIPTLTPTGEPTVATTPTATASPGGPCTGDCDGGGDVTVDEIVRGVNIALGNRTIDDCLAFDRNGDGFVTVDEIVEAIGNALNGC